MKSNNAGFYIALKMLLLIMYNVLFSRPVSDIAYSPH